MQSAVPKQYLMLEDKPVIYYSLKAFQDSFIDRIVLVTSEEGMEYCRKNVVEKYNFGKVTDIVAGERKDIILFMQGLKRQNAIMYLSMTVLVLLLHRK